MMVDAFCVLNKISRRFYFDLVTDLVLSYLNEKIYTVTFYSRYLQCMNRLWGLAKVCRLFMRGLQHYSIASYSLEQS